jgi:hypothetical protein
MMVAGGKVGAAKSHTKLMSAKYVLTVSEQDFVSCDSIARKRRLGRSNKIQAQ